MFFKSIKEWSLKKLRINWVVWECIYLCCSLLAPMITIMIKYKLFTNFTKKSVNGLALIVLLIFAILGLRQLRKAIEKLPDTTYKQQCLKYPLQMLYALFYPVLFIIISCTFRDDAVLAFHTFVICSAFIIASIVVDYLCLKFIDREMTIRKNARELLEQQDRINRGVC